MYDSVYDGGSGAFYGKDVPKNDRARRLSNSISHRKGGLEKKWHAYLGLPVKQKWQYLSDTGQFLKGGVSPV